jgi:hypothetical protein
MGAYDPSMSDEQGEPRPDAQRMLDRAPGERYRSRPAYAAASAAPVPLPAERSMVVAIGVPMVVAGAGAAMVAVLGSFDIGAGLLAVSGFIGWAVGVAVVWSGVPDSDARGQRALWAVVLAVASIVLGIVVLWIWSHVEGGVMDPFAYLDERFGPIVYLNVIVAGVVAYLRTR